MMKIDVPSIKLQLIQMLLQTENEEVLTKINALLNQEKLATITSYNEELAAAESRVFSGKYISQEDIEDESGK